MRAWSLAYARVRSSVAGGGPGEHAARPHSGYFGEELGASFRDRGGWRLDLLVPKAQSYPAGPRILLNRQEAAAALRMSINHFAKHVDPYVPKVHTGSLTLYRLKTLEDWAKKSELEGGRRAA
jgi:hypothetical protein